ncbi:MAG: peroxiredoxin family protein [Candidatus Poribacteria bacterium]|nr:peroxiredoxin family protein [Candidatus Poribacteria bacterium]
MNAPMNRIVSTGLTLLVVLTLASCSGKKTMGETASAPDAMAPVVGNEVGNMAPDFMLASVGGANVSLDDYDGETLVLVFYRGNWCPFCHNQLATLQEEMAKFDAAGAKIVAISPDELEFATATAEAEGLTFPVLSDTTRETVKSYGVFHDAINGSLPATFVIDRTGIIRWKYIGKNKQDRPLPELVLEQVAAANSMG